MAGADNLRRLIAERDRLEARRDSLVSRKMAMRASPNFNPQQFQATLDKLKEVNRALVKMPELIGGSANQLATAALRKGFQSITQAATSALVAGAALGATMKEAMSHWNPAAVIRFEQRVGDLSAVVGSILAPAFEKLTGTIHQLSNWLLNLDPATKKLISDWATMLVPITAVGVGLSGLILLFRPLVTIGVAAVNLLTAAFWRLAAAQAAGGGAGVGGFIGRGVGAVGGGLAGGAIAKQMGGGLVTTILSTILGSVIGAKGLGGIGKLVGGIAAPKMFMGMPVAGQGKGFMGAMGRLAGAGMGALPAGAAATGGMMAGASAIALGGALGIDRLINARYANSVAGNRQGFTLDTISDAWKQVGSGGRSASWLSDDRRQKANADINAERKRLGLAGRIDENGMLTKDAAKIKSLDSPKDSTNLDAARSAVTLTSVMDVGRRIREQALTSAGHMEPWQQAIVDIRDQVAEVAPNARHAVDANQRRVNIAQRGQMNG